MCKTDTNPPIIMWFRQDLRISDNPALCYAVETGKPIILLFIYDIFSAGLREIGAAQKWWLHHSLVSLSKDITTLGNRLVLKRGAAADIIAEVQGQSGADELVWNRRYGEAEQDVDRSIKSNFNGSARSFAGLLLHEPSKTRTGAGGPYRVYTPFWKNLMNAPPPRHPFDRPVQLPKTKHDLAGEHIDHWGFLPTSPNWAEGLREEWRPGEAGAAVRLEKFMSERQQKYDKMRDHPGPDQTSKLSPHLRFGEISPNQLWHASLTAEANLGKNKGAAEKWRQELVWREFSYHLLQEWPDLAGTNFNRNFDRFEWRTDPAGLKAWKQGKTGYPIVDAGMRQLYQTGWMHNRVRMITGSFLVKHLMIDWREGERWFWDSLVDGDPASNPASWQWIAGTGADAAPYFRIFNPMLQSKKFDNSGAYIKKFVPELKNLPPEYLDAPWDAPTQVLETSGVILGRTYPAPIVEHRFARERALNTLNASKEINENE